MNPERWRQIDELLQSTLARAPEERAAFLAEACAGDESLQREVGSLLAAHDRPDGLLETPLSQIASEVLEPTEAALREGQVIGPYRVLARVGAGGMGEVYRAHDTRLDREVALKVLPASYAGDTDRLRRFEQEARAVAALNHPNIVTLHDVGRHEGTSYLVSELLEGETLRARLDREALPWRKAVEVAASMAEGLAAAHGKGIVHRDLKPANIFLTKDGRVKLLDFGLAKLWSPAAEGRTEPGQVLGTAGYMSPEQVAGRAVDARSDLFALGGILYEMVSGRRAFQRPTSAETMAAVLNEEPAEVDAPVDLKRLIAHCLEKDPDARFQSARDLLFNLRALLEAAPSGQLRRRAPSRWTAVAGIALLALIGALATLRARASRPISAGAVRFAIPAPEETSLGWPRVSPDGRRVLSAVRVGDKTMLWLRALGAAEGQAIPNTEAAAPLGLSWSFDGESVVMAVRRTLVRVDLKDPGRQTVLYEGESLAGWGMTVDAEGNVLVGRDGNGIHRVPAGGGPPALLLPREEQEFSQYWPQVLPDGRHFLYFSRRRNPEEHALCVASLDGKTRKELMRSSSLGLYSSGHLLFVKDKILRARRFDLDRLEVSGDPVPVVDDVGQGGYGIAAFSASNDGVLAWRTSFGIDAELVWMDRSGRRLGSLGPPGDYANPEISPDGRRVLVDLIDTSNRDLWTFDVADGRPMRLTFDPEIDHIPAWSPDGRRVVFDSHRGGAGDLYLKAADGDGPEELLLARKEGTGVMDWSPDGRFIAFGGGTPQNRGDIWMLPLDGERQPFAYVETQVREGSARFSPDGRWVAYMAESSGRAEVFVQPFAGGPVGRGGKWQISTGGGLQPMWRRDGRELFFMTRANEMMAVDVRTSGTFQAGTPRRLFEIRFGAGRRGPRNDYSVTPDGQRFLIRLATSPSSSPIHVVVNWPALVAR